jgi:hypothetical protein
MENEKRIKRKKERHTVQVLLKTKCKKREYFHILTPKDTKAAIKSKISFLSLYRYEGCSEKSYQMKTAVNIKLGL